MIRIKKFLQSYLTADEQKIIFFLLISGFLGIVLHFTGLQAADEEADSLKAALEEPYQIIYDINTITDQELQTIPGIGAVRAQAIIEYRDQNKPISAEELINVRGIGKVTLANLKEYFSADDISETEKSNSLEHISSERVIQKESTGSVLQQLNINDATLDDLMRAGGVGEVRGESIIGYITEQGRIKNIDQLLEIRGIGPRTLENIKELFYADDDR